MPRVTLTNTGSSIFVAQGTALQQAARLCGLVTESPCGGQGRCGKCRAIVNGEEVLACQFRVEEDIIATFPQNEELQILKDGQARMPKPDPLRKGYLLALDIGTTTVVAYLTDETGKELAACPAANPQAAYGADVVSRLQYAARNGGDALTKAVRSTAEQLISACCAAAGIEEAEIAVIAAVGNPCMQQLFLGLPLENLITIPYRPLLQTAATLPAEKYLPLCPGAVLVTAPDISAYVGADTVACMLAADFLHREETTLLVDIGTNGEMALLHQGRIAACSTAAGPALEGANIRFGMTAAKGAIDRVTVQAGTLQCHTIGGDKAVGICGSGLIDATAAALQLHWLDGRGRIQRTDLWEGERFIPLTEDICLTQEDIRQLQLAKGAIAAGISLLCQQLGVEKEEIRRVLLCGAFGSFLNPGSACSIGLLPKELEGKTVSAGNLAGAGARMLALDRSQLAAAEQLAARTEYLDLGSVPEFRRAFAASMRFE